MWAGWTVAKYAERGYKEGGLVCSVQLADSWATLIQVRYRAG